MFDRAVEQAHEQEVFSREDPPTEQRVEAAFLYHAGLSYRCVERLDKGVRQWYISADVPVRARAPYHSAIAINETKLKVEETEIYVCVAGDVDTFEVIHIEVSPRPI